MLQAIDPPVPEDRDESGPDGPPPVLTLAAALGLAWAATWLSATSIIILESLGVGPLTDWGAQAVQTLEKLAGASPALIVLVQGPLAAILLAAVLSAMAGRHAARAMFAFWAWLSLGVGAMSLLFAMRITALGWGCMAYALATLWMLMLPSVAAHFARTAPEESPPEPDESDADGARDLAWLDDVHEGP